MVPYHFARARVPFYDRYFMDVPFFGQKLVIWLLKMQGKRKYASKNNMFCIFEIRPSSGPGLAECIETLTKNVWLLQIFDQVAVTFIIRFFRLPLRKIWTKITNDVHNTLLVDSEHSPGESLDHQAVFASYVLVHPSYSPLPLDTLLMVLHVE